MALIIAGTGAGSCGKEICSMAGETGRLIAMSFLTSLYILLYLYCCSQDTGSGGCLARNKMYLYGKNSVHERLKTDPGSIRQVYLQDNFNAPHITDLLKANKIPAKVGSENDLMRIKRADRLQGIVAEIYKYQYTPLDELLSGPGEKRPSLIFLDNLNDPHNLGSIMRIAACFGALGSYS